MDEKDTAGLSDNANPTNPTAVGPEVGRTTGEPSTSTAEMPALVDDAMASWTWSISADEKAFDAIVASVRQAIAGGINPERIKRGTSGTYFVKNPTGKIVGVFKPGDEAQYSENNPNCIKQLQKIFFPCLYGRGCLVPNTGCLCETGAYRLDKMLGLQMVPVTQLVYLSAPTFNYTRRTRKTCIQQNKPLPPKLGSLQLFAEKFLEAQTFFSSANERLLAELIEDRLFLFEFQKLAILDYVMRNTDRGMDNWLIKRQTIPQLLVKIVAIDHGLAFPQQHPSRCRSFPYSWAKMPFAKIPFMEEVRDLCLSNIHSLVFGSELEQQLLQVFQTDPYFKRETFEKQMQVIRGQMANVADALDKRESPEDLANKELILISKELTLEKLCEHCTNNNATKSASIALLQSSAQTVESEAKFKCSCEIKIKWKKAPVNGRPICHCW